MRKRKNVSLVQRLTDRAASMFDRGVISKHEIIHMLGEEAMKAPPPTLEKQRRQIVSGWWTSLRQNLRRMGIIEINGTLVRANEISQTDRSLISHKAVDRTAAQIIGLANTARMTDDDEGWRLACQAFAGLYDMNVEMAAEVLERRIA